MDPKEENVLRIENEILKGDFKAYIIQWRQKKKINKYLEKLYKMISENIEERKFKKDCINSNKIIGI